MNDSVTIELTHEELSLLINRYEKSLEKDSVRGEIIPEIEFTLLRKLTDIQ